MAPVGAGARAYWSFFLLLFLSLIFMKVSFLRRGWGPASLAALLLLTGCGKGKPADNARAEAADNPTETSSPAASETASPTADEQTAAAEATPETGDGGDNNGSDGDSGGGSGSSTARPAVSAEAATSTWVCTWCHEEYTGSRQPTSFQPGKCERNPGKAHAWHKK